MLAAVCVFLCTFVNAGDAAAFVDLGFSKDGRVYMFAQHGSTDKLWQGFAEISGCFKTSASAQTEGINGSTVYEKLFEKNKAYIRAVSPEPADLKHTLYIKNLNKEPLEEIVFTDFEGSTEENPVFFHIRLIPWFSGKTASSKSSFFISVERKDKNGTLLSKHVAGNPDIKRTGVTDYTIEKIIRSPDNKSLIFAVEKKLTSSTGVSVRYMTEALRLK